MQRKQLCHFCGERTTAQKWPRIRRATPRSSGPAWPSPGKLLGLESRRLAFIDFWPGFYDNTDLWIGVNWFRRNLPGVEIVSEHERPDVILFTLFGRSFVQYLQRGCRAKMVFFSGENKRPPVRKVPLCISFDRLPGLPLQVHLRLPLWVLVREVHDVLRMHQARLRGQLDRRVRERPGFCSFVASNASMYNAKVRNSFVQALSLKYQQVTCGGEVMNNVGGPVKDKLAFLRGHRFNVAFENASYPGYCTEKVLHAFAAGCVPIYWGDPNLSSSASKGGASIADFNPAALISAHDFASEEELVRHIKNVDRDPELFEEYLRQPILADYWYERLQDWPRFCEGFMGLLFSDAGKGTPAVQLGPAATNG